MVLTELLSESSGRQNRPTVKDPSTHTGCPYLEVSWLVTLWGQFLRPPLFRAVLSESEKARKGGDPECENLNDRSYFSVFG